MIQTVSHPSVAPRTAILEVESGIKGVAIAGTILILWSISLGLLLSLNLAHYALWLAGFLMLWQTFLYTGLFITAHDAMHGAVAPYNPRLNHTIGSITLMVYSLFSYRELMKKHWQHHKHPVTQLDPDSHDGIHTNFLSWYFHFMKGYWSWGRILGLALIFLGLHLGFGVAIANLVVFWMVPPILSSVQLFYFGTYLPHREPAAGYQNGHRTQSTALPVFWSFITCYHFGYHQEHHEFPHLSWWKLPMAYWQHH